MGHYYFLAGDLRLDVSARLVISTDPQCRAGRAVFRLYGGRFPAVLEQPVEVFGDDHVSGRQWSRLGSPQRRPDLVPAVAVPVLFVWYRHHCDLDTCRHPHLVGDHHVRDKCATMADLQRTRSRLFARPSSDRSVPLARLDQVWHSAWLADLWRAFITSLGCSAKPSSAVTASFPTLSTI